MSNFNIISAAILSLYVLNPAAAVSSTSDRCTGYEAAVVIETALHTMTVCLDGQEKSTYRVALGRGGVGKQKRGDKKTPLGSFALGSPRPSSRYLLFIPVGFPNEEQRAQGASGGNIGIHGPHREFLWLGTDSAEADWTHGCIAVGTDAEIMEMARIVRENGITSVIIR